MIRKLASVLALAVGLTLIAMPATAEANISGKRWGVPRVCIEDHAASRWPISTVGWKYDRHPELYVRTRTSCDGWQRVIRIYSRNYGDVNLCGSADVDGYGTDNRWIRKVTIRLNEHGNCNDFYRRRAHIVSHEIGHGFGLAHNYRSTFDTVMSTRVGNETAYPGSYDFHELHRIY